MHPGLRVAMAVYGDITHDSRVQREAIALADAGHTVSVYCLGWSSDLAPRFDDRIDVVVLVPERSEVTPGTVSPFLERSSRSMVRRLGARAGWLVGYVRNLRAWGRMALVRADRADVWHLHDFAALVAIASRVEGGVPIVYDVHDIFAETGSGRHLPGLLRRAARAYEQWLVRRSAFIVAVNGGIAADIEQRSRGRKVIVVHNAAPRWVVPDPRPDLIRQHAGLSPGTPVVLYHGLLSRQRGLERLCEAMLEPELREVHLALLGYGPLQDTLIEIAGDPRYLGRIHVLDAVAPDALLPWVASADVGAMAMPPATKNLVLSTPNKLFECLAAGTPPVVSDFPLIRRIVMDDPGGPLGAICDPSDTRSVALALAGILRPDPEIRMALRRRCHAAADERWNWEAEAGRLVAEYGRLNRATEPAPVPAGHAP